jgi:D-alanine-D-alanine ligase
MIMKRLHRLGLKQPLLMPYDYQTSSAGTANITLENTPMVIIFHSPINADAPPDEQDVLEEVAFFRSGLESLGYKVSVLPFDYDLIRLGELLEKEKPSFLVNLTETLFGDGRLVHVAPAIFDHFGIRYTGCLSEAIYITSHKILSKKLMIANEIPTPGYLDFENVRDSYFAIPIKPYIIKSLWEHASFGLDERKKLLFSHREELLSGFISKGTSASQHFAEEYIHGREFNVSMVGTKNGPQVLPVAEMAFDYPDNMPRIVGYRAKWDSDSFEYQHTNRKFLDDSEDTELQQTLHTLCLKCWDVFQLRGYARVDFRVDTYGNIYVLEVNANPCISSDSGFVAAALRAGLSPSDLTANIIDECLKENN